MITATYQGGGKANAKVNAEFVAEVRHPNYKTKYKAKPSTE